MVKRGDGSSDEINPVALAELGMEITTTFCVSILPTRLSRSASRQISADATGVAQFESEPLGVSERVVPRQQKREIN